MSTKKISRLWWLASLPLLGVGAWLLLPGQRMSQYKTSPRPTEAPSDAPDPAFWFDRKAPFSQLFVGSASCLSCHSAQHSSWKKTSHSIAMQAATPDSVLGDFNGKSVNDEGVSASMSQQGDQYIFTLNDKNNQSVSTKIDYVLGGKRAQEYLTRREDGRLQVLPLSYSTSAKRWFAPLALTVKDISAKSPFFWENSRRTFNRECFDCHVTGMEVRYDPTQDRYDSTWVEMGVSCEACHGPGRQHAEKPAGDNIINPRALSQERQLSLCGRCHSARSMHFSQFNSDNTFFPGDLYEDYFSPVLLGQLGPNGGPSFYPDVRPKEPGVEYQALLQSRCYQNSRMTCSTCHSDHEALDPTSNALCGGCHSEQLKDMSEHSKHKSDGAASRCVSCHMPKIIPTLSGAVTDHTIDIPNPENTKDFDIPSACVSCHTERSAEWAVSQFRTLFRSDRASRRRNLANLFLAAGDIKVAKQIDDKLIALLQDQRESGLIRSVAVSVLRGYRNKKSIAALIGVLRDRDVWIRANAAAGLALLGNNNKTPEATTALEAMLKDSSRWVQLQAAISLYAFGEASAREHIEAWVRGDFPQWYRLRALLALNATQRSLFDIAQEDARIALIDKPDFVEMYRLLYSIFNSRGQAERAQEEFQKMLRFDPAASP
jgi:hypothetical protein